MNPSTKQVYISVFLSQIKNRETPSLGEKEGWPYDYGDDPSFKASKELHGPLTWGVCRPNVRNKIGSGDIAVFFSCSRSKDTGNSTYHLCSIATVGRKVRQTDFRRTKSLRQFEGYSNLLVRPLPSSRGWEHYEPPHSGPHGHPDWLSRIADRADFRKKDFEKVESTDRFGPQTRIRGRLIEIAPNYVIFSSSKSETLVLANPPIVAHFSPGQPHESWRRDKLTRSIRECTLGQARRSGNLRRWLRIGTDRHPHPHPPISFEMPQEKAERWRMGLIGLVGRP